MTLVSSTPLLQDVGVPIEHERDRSWTTWYTRRVRLVDLSVGALAAVTSMATHVIAGNLTNNAATRYSLLSVALVGAWMTVLALSSAYDPRFTGDGAEESRRVLWADVQVVCLLVLVSFAFAQPVSRAYVLTLFVCLGGYGVVGRYVVRRGLHQRRSRGECVQRVLAVGHEAGVLELVRNLSREPHHGLCVIGACLPEGRPQVLDMTVPTFGGYDKVMQAITTMNADTVAVVGAPELRGHELRRLAWELEAAGVSLVVAPGLVEVAGPRVSVRPVAGLSLLQVEPAARSGGRLVVKAVIDRSLAALALLMLLPVMLAIGVAVRLDSRGTALFSQTRVGEGGRTFRLWKFRSMVQDAPAVRSGLDALNETDGLLFKIRKDPRVTRVGLFIRRYSLDELPQLFNVLRGDMSLVGPRPPLPEEVAQYDDDTHRRLLVRPGITGLWQVSGRADLSWEESVRLDLRYVDNWSLGLDLLVIWKTCRAVFRGAGAY